MFVKNILKIISFFFVFIKKQRSKKVFALQNSQKLYAERVCITGMDLRKIENNSPAIHDYNHYHLTTGCYQQHMLYAGGNKQQQASFKLFHFFANMLQRSSFRHSSTSSSCCCCCCCAFTLGLGVNSGVNMPT